MTTTASWTKIREYVGAVSQHTEKIDKITRPEAYSIDEVLRAISDLEDVVSGFKVYLEDLPKVTPQPDGRTTSEGAWWSKDKPEADNG